MTTIYITTPIYYVNDIPHIGHSYTTILADILSRYYKMTGHDVFFLTGTDEHGQKIEKAAEAKGLSPKQLVDEVVLRYKALWAALDIDYSRFIRTTDLEHKNVVRSVFKDVFERGHIYLGEYEGLYCRPCETYYTETQSIEGRCPECNRELTLLKEEAFFFRLSAFQESLLSYIETVPSFVLPITRRNEVLSFIRSGLNDLCITRSAINWGIEIPEIAVATKQKHYIYVWFDALLNYISGIKYGQDDAFFNRYWPANIQLLGKDILKFHAVIWPAMLMALDLPLPKHVFGHGFIYQSGEKMSKSKGNVLDPYVLLNEYGVDAFRYFLSREIVMGLDGSYSDENMKQRFNSDLANDWGNLLNRTLNMMKKYFNGVIPTTSIVNGDLPSVDVLRIKGATLFNNIQELMDEFKLSLVLEEIFLLIRQSNKYIEDQAPWVLAKNGKLDQLAYVMTEVLEAVRLASLFLFPFMPSTVKRVFQQLNIPIDFSLITKEHFSWGYFQSGMILGEPEPLFPRKI